MRPIKLFLLAFLLLSITNSQAQSPLIAVSNDDHNFIYVGIDNPLTILVDGYSPDKITVTTNTGTLSGSKGKYTINIKTFTRAKLSIIADGKEIGQRELRPRRIPDPRSFLRLKNSNGEAMDIPSGKEVHKDQLQSVEGVVAYIQNFEFDEDLFKVVSYDIRFTKVAGTRKGLKFNSSDDITKKLKESLLTARPGDKITISNIKAKGPDDQIRTLEDITILVR